VLVLGGSAWWAISWINTAAQRGRIERRNQAIDYHNDQVIPVASLLFGICDNAWGPGSGLCGTETGIALSAPLGTQPAEAQAVGDACARELSLQFPSEVWTVNIQVNEVVIARAASTLRPVVVEPSFSGPSPDAK
jgi:hypothetical protein